MDNSETILSELQEIAPTLITLNKNVYTTPTGYFNNFANELLGCINADALLAEAKKTAPVFQVPDNYFDTLAGSIIQKIKQQNNEYFVELEEVAPLLNTINKKNIYSLPQGYFEHLNIIIPAKKLSGAKVVFLSKTRRLISYAAAAVIAGVLVTGAIFYPGNSASFDVSKEVNKLSDAELNGYLESAHSISFMDDTMILNQESPSIQEHLKLVSDQELQQYLDENGSDEAAVQSKDGI